MEKDLSTITLKIPGLENQLDRIEKLCLEILEQRKDVLEGYISKNNFLKKFEIKKDMFYKLINQGKLKIYRIDRKIYLKSDEVNEALEKGELR